VNDQPGSHTVPVTAPHKCDFTLFANLPHSAYIHLLFSSASSLGQRPSVFFFSFYSEAKFLNKALNIVTIICIFAVTIHF